VLRSNAESIRVAATVGDASYRDATGDPLGFHKDLHDMDRILDLAKDRVDLMSFEHQDAYEDLFDRADIFCTFMTKLKGEDDFELLDLSKAKQVYNNTLKSVRRHSNVLIREAKERARDYTDTIEREYRAKHMQLINDRRKMERSFKEMEDEFEERVQEEVDKRLHPDALSGDNKRAIRL